MSFVLLGILNSQAAGAGAASAYELIEGQTLTSNTSSVEFSSIPQDYQSLQLRMTVRADGGGSTNQAYIRFNGNSSSVYANVFLFGLSSTASASNFKQGWGNLEKITSTVAGANYFASYVLDVFDYASTTKYTQTMYMGGENNISAMYMGGFVYSNTSAVTSLEVSASDGDLAAGSEIALYGLKGA